MKVGFVDIDGAVVEVDYTSQENVDLQKRRKHLFRVELSNRTEFMFQAPSDDRRKAWCVFMLASHACISPNHSQLCLAYSQPARKALPIDVI